MLKCQKILKPTQLLQLIGLLKEESQELKIKVNADHAGHSQPPVLLNHGLFSVENHGIFQNNNSLTVHHHTEITDVTVDGHQALLIMLKPTDLLLNNHIHMLLKPELVKRTEVNSELVKFYQFQDAMDYQLELPADHSQSPLMLPTGHNINQVFSTTVEPALTTPSS